MQARIKPNLFIVGAPKCGTTSMADYLSQHPDVFMAGREIHYFGSDLYEAERMRQNRPRATEAEYLKNFEQAEGHAVVGEKSVSYLHSTSAPQEIAEFNPASRVIIMLRNPVDFIYSLHAQQLHSGTETLVDLADALQAEEERMRQGSPFRLFYRRNADFAPDVERYYSVFGKGRVRVILLDDLIEDVKGVYRSTLEFLDLEPRFEARFEVLNQRKTTRSSRFANVTRMNNPIARRAMKLLVPSHRVRKLLASSTPAFRSSRPIPTPRNPGLRRELEVEMAPRIARLAEVIERDLSHWVPEPAR
jgi:hypothetical protein